MNPSVKSAKLSANQLRQAYLNFFAGHGHAIIPSAALVPENDPSTLFTSSGMQPLVPYLLGQKHPEGQRLVDSQKSFRSQDIEEVGDNRHTTFFEMLGNWSLGDYFKQDQLSWVFEFLTHIVGIAPEKLFVTVFAGNEALRIPKDTEAVEIWQRLFKSVGIDAKAVDKADEKGMQAGRIFYYPEKKNWWSRSGTPDKMPAGEPGGPDSEVFYDFGEKLGLHEKSEWKDEPCHVNCDCGRFLEIGNSVFMQYQKQADGSFQELPQKNVDFGGGLERILAASQDQRDVFKTELFWPIIEQIEKLSGKKYGSADEITYSFRLMADHIKASVMLANDGVVPSNKAQGYFLRRLIRRAIHHANKIGISTQFLSNLVVAVTEIYEKQYPELSKKKKEIINVLSEEEDKFKGTLSNGLREFGNEGLKKLHDYWHKLATEGGWIPDTAKAVGAEAFYFYQSWGIPVDVYMDVAEKEFGIPPYWPIAYENLNLTVREMITDEFNRLKEQHTADSRTASAGMFKGGLADHSEITTKYHTTTHLLQAALRKVLGNHVQQKGSNITAERMRFDFSHSAPVTPEQIQQVQDQINEWIKANLPVTVQTMQKQAALDSGAIAFFVEKYPDQVTVYTIGKDPEKDWISKELCGGPHVKSTGEIGEIELFKEQSASAGVRRIYAKVK